MGMISAIVDKLNRAEGDLKVLVSQTDSGNKVFLQSGRSTHVDLRLRGKYPLEAPIFTQSLSTSSGIAHAIASVSALEDYLHIYPTETGLRIRQVLLDMAAIRSHIYHFYWQVLPDYLNIGHYKTFSQNDLSYYSGLYFKEKEVEDLSQEIGIKLLAHVNQAATVIDLLQKNLTLFGGKYPVIMNQVPGGVSNFSIPRSINMKVIRNLEICKPFIEETWPLDVKELVRNTPETIAVLGEKLNLISFGSLPIEINRGKTSNYSEGVLLDGKLEPVNELKITETVDNTFYLPIEKAERERKARYDFNKPGAITWIKGARYLGEPMLTGALPRMIVTHLAGGNLEISDKIGQIIDDLELTFEAPNCIASRLLAEVIESRIYLKNILRNLFDLDYSQETNRKTYFGFSEKGVGIGKIESPAGSLMHQVFIEDGQIVQYRIVSASNWNFAPTDSNGDSGEVEQDLNSLFKARKLTASTANRLLHSYYPLVLDGTQ
jgi:Ni,Fe-hydrogenase I large subunit